jgi:TolB-like protein
VVLVLIAGLWLLYSQHRRPAQVPVQDAAAEPRPTVAVMKLRNLTGRADCDWISRALSEMLATELATGGQLSSVPGELVAQTQAELSLPEVDAYGQHTLRRLRRTLPADLLILGSYFLTPQNGDSRLRLDLRVQDTQSGEVVLAVAKSGSQQDLIDMVAQVGQLLRSRLGQEQLPPATRPPPGAKALVLAQPSPATPARLSTGFGYPAVRSYRSAGGQVWAVVQDRDGIIYSGSSLGLTEWDGGEQKLIRVANASTVRSLAYDRHSNCVFVGAQGDIGYLRRRSGRTEYVSLLDRVAPEQRRFADVWKVHAAPEGIYFQTYKYLFLYSKGEIRCWPSARRFHFSYYLRSTLYILEQGTGLLRLHEGKLELVPGGRQIADDRLYVMLPYGDDSDGDERFILGTREQGLLLLTSDGMVKLESPVEELIRGQILYCGERLADGSYAFGTILNGLVIMDESGAVLMTIGQQDGINDASVYCIHKGREGALWLGHGNGFSRVGLFSPLSVLDRRAGIDGLVTGFARHGQNLYAATIKGVLVLEQGQGKQPVFEPVPGTQMVYDLLAAGDQVLAAGQHGVYAITGQRARLLAECVATTLYRSHEHPQRILVGLVDGVLCLAENHGEWQVEGRIQGVDDSVRSFAELGDDSLWVGTMSSGVVRLRYSGEDPLQPVVERYSPDAGLPQGRAWVCNLHGYLVALTPGGPYRFDDDTGVFTSDPRFAFLTDEYAAEESLAITDITEDQRGGHWIRFSLHAPIRVDLARGVVYSEESSALRPLKHLGIFKIFSDNDGILWLVSEASIFRVDFSVSPALQVNTRTLIRRATVSSQLSDRLRFGDLPPGTGIELARVESGVRFDCALPSFADEQYNELRYRMDGLEEHWSPWSGEKYRRYAGLIPGRYRFLVQGRTATGRLSGITELELVLRAPWYRSRAAITAYLTLALVLLITAHRLRARQLL